jgi:hypothetical protein
MAREVDTVKIRLGALPEPYRTKALIGVNTSPLDEALDSDSIEDVIRHGFYWSGTNEGHAFWSRVADILNKDEPLPPPVSFPLPWPR